MTRNSQEIYDVVIAGGSFVGLSLALCLNRSLPSASRILVVDAVASEPAANAGADARASAISAASQKLFEAINVWPKVAGAAQPLCDIEITDTPLTNAVRSSLLHFETTLNDGAPAAYIVENHFLRTALLNAVRECNGITLMAPARITGHHVGPHGVEIALENCDSVQGRLLVAADGRASPIRRRSGIKTIGWQYDQIGIAATVAHERDHDGRAIQHFLPAGPLAMLPLTGRRSSLVWTEDARRGAEIMASDDEAFLSELTRRFGHRLGELDLAGPRISYPLGMHVARRFIADRIALAGDAAHGVHPLAGQGLNIGLRDVAALAEVVIDSMRLGLDIGTEPVLERYERWRRFDTILSSAAMDALNRLFSNDAGPLRAARSLGLGIVDRLPPLKHGFVQEAAGLSGELPKLLRGELA